MIGILNKDGICNSILCISMETAQTQFPNQVIVEIDNADFLYRKYENGKWSIEKYPPPEPEKIDETAETLKFRLNMEYRLSMLELKSAT